MSDTNSSVSEASQPPMDVVYPLNEELEVPGTDGGLFKTVLVEGTGTKPVKGAKVTVHYVGTLDDGTKFDSSRDRGEHFEFTLGKGQVIKGWDKGVATMSIGEKAILKCSSEYGYGPSGSPPKIPPNATLFFEVELFDWTRQVDISAGKDRSLLKDVLIDGVDYENPDFESTVTADVSVFLGIYDTSKVSGAAMMKPVWDKKGWRVTIGESKLPPMLEECFKSMRNKESAVFHVRSDLVADEVAEFSIPSAVSRNNVDISYVVEIQALKSVKSWEFTGLNKVAEGLARKDKGNVHFKSGDLALSERFYRRAMEFVGEDYGFSGDEKTECQKARVVVMGNLSQVLLMKKEYAEVIDFSKKILLIEGDNKKALFRLAKAQDALQEWDEALRSIQKILSVDPDNADAKALEVHVMAAQKAFDKKQKSMFKRMFS